MQQLHFTSLVLHISVFIPDKIAGLDLFLICFITSCLEHEKLVSIYPWNVRQNLNKYYPKENGKDPELPLTHVT